MLLDPAAEQRAIDGSVYSERSNEAFHSQRSEEGSGLPATTGSLFHQSHADRSAAVAPRHVGFGPRFINENDFVGIDLLLRSSPLGTLLDDIGAILLAGNQRLFFRDCFNARQALQMVAKQTSTPRSCFSSSCSSRR